MVGLTPFRVLTTLLIITYLLSPLGLQAIAVPLRLLTILITILIVYYTAVY